jgi:cytochrome b561
MPFHLLIPVHVFGGGLILALVLWRVALRLTRGAPAPAAGKSLAQQRIQRLVWGALYALMILMPISGALAWFGGVEAAAVGHGVMKVALLALVAIHVLATVVEQVAGKDNPMRRMREPAA